MIFPTTQNAGFGQCIPRPQIIYRRIKHFPLMVIYAVSPLRQNSCRLKF